MRFHHDVSDDVKPSDVKPSHTGGRFEPPPSGLQDAWARRWLTAAKFLVAPIIILVVVAILLPVFLNARKPSYELRCMAKLKQVAAAMTMYALDNGGYPPSTVWHTALRVYIEDPRDPEGRVEPGSKGDPLKCPSDTTDAPVSYLYLNRGLLHYSKASLNDSVVPLAVDEYFHEHVTLAYYDGHTERIPREQWVNARMHQWQIRRDLDHPSTFAYEPVPGSVRGPTGPRPNIDPGEMYIFPNF